MILNLVNDLLDLAKIESFKFKLDERYFNLVNVVHQSQVTMEPLTEFKKIQVKSIFSVNLRNDELSLHNFEDRSDDGEGSFNNRLSDNISYQ